MNFDMLCGELLAFPPYGTNSLVYIATLVKVLYVISGGIGCVCLSDKDLHRICCMSPYIIYAA
jgi:hypothetical protein